jgi:hypothetical protein
MAKSGTRSAAGRIRIRADKLGHLVADEERGILNSPQKLLSALQDTPASDLIPQLLSTIAERSRVDATVGRELTKKVIVHDDHLEVQVSLSILRRCAGIPVTTNEHAESNVSIKVPVQPKQRGPEIG